MKHTLLVLAALLLTTPAIHAQLYHLQMESHDVLADFNYDASVGHHFHPVPAEVHFETFIQASPLVDPNHVPAGIRDWHMYGFVEGFGHFNEGGGFAADGNPYVSGVIGGTYLNGVSENFTTYINFSWNDDFTVGPSSGGVIMAYGMDPSADNRFNAYSTSISLTPVPEPATYTALGGAMLLIALAARANGKTANEEC